MPQPDLAELYAQYKSLEAGALGLISRDDIIENAHALRQTPNAYVADAFAQEQANELGIELPEAKELIQAHAAKYNETQNQYIARSLQIRIDELRKKAEPIKPSTHRLAEFAARSMSSSSTGPAARTTSAAPTLSKAALPAATEPVHSGAGSADGSPTTQTDDEMIAAALGITVAELMTMRADTMRTADQTPASSSKRALPAATEPVRLGGASKAAGSPAGAGLPEPRAQALPAGLFQAFAPRSAAEIAEAQARLAVRPSSAAVQCPTIEVHEPWMIDNMNLHWVFMRKPRSERLMNLNNYLWAKNKPTTRTPEDQQHLDDVTKNLTGQYKIHLMPTDENYAETVTRVVEALNTDPELQAAANMAKFAREPEPRAKLFTQDPNSIIPRIVIYSNIGKEHAQTILNKMLALFGDTPGLDVTPRFNQRVTSLIYFAQGNGDDKKHPALQDLFEAPELIYYAPNFAEQPADYRLTW